MNLSQIQVWFLPVFDALSGLLGTMDDLVVMPSSDDTIVILITFLYELDPLRSLF